MRIHILTPGFASPNGRAFLFPLIVHAKTLAAHGLHIVFKTNADDSLGDCNVLIVDSKFHRDQWECETQVVLEQFSIWRERADKVLYFDTTDSTGSLQSELLPYVDGYLKSQLLIDRKAYLTPHYGHRIFSDYYHRTQGVEDAKPQFSRPVDDPADLQKLKVSWNSGLADYSLYGIYRMALYNRIPLRALLTFPTTFTDSRRSRHNLVSCRFGTIYTRETVAWQRKTIRTIMGSRLATDKLSRRRYFQEMENSLIVVSPFGLGEITLKDFEVFLTGGLLFKPDMSHMETWPDLFRAGETMLTHRWDLNDFEENLIWAQDHPKEAADIAEQGQDEYKRHILLPSSGELFVNRFESILDHD